MKKKDKLYNALFSVAAVLFLWILWLVAALAVGNGYILPSVGETFAAMGTLLAEGAFWRAFGGTFLRTLIAFAVSFAAGLALAAIAGAFPRARAFFAPIVSVLRSVPTMAIILILLLWSTPRAAPAIVSFLVLMPAVYAAALAEFDEVRREYGELARAFGVGARRKIFGMYLPLSAPNLLGQAGAILSMGLKITVSGEVLSNTFHSLGGMMQDAKMFVDMPRLMALTLVAVFVGFALEGLCVLAKFLLVRWQR